MKSVTRQASQTKNALSTPLPIAPSKSIELVESEPGVFMEINKLQDHGINMADILKLKNSGYCTVLSIIQTTKKELVLVKGLSEIKVDKIVEAAIKIEMCNSFMTGIELQQRRTKVLKLTTGSSVLDQALGGGIETMAITELFGENRTGKTQICHTLCVTAQLPPSLNGGNRKVCFIDTEGTFRPEKIVKIGARYNIEPEIVLENIMYARAFTHEHIITLLSAAASKMCENNFTLLIIDSIMSLFRVDFAGRGELAERQQKLNKLLSGLSKLSEQFNIAILLTNHVISEPSGAMSFVANPIKPAGGHVLGHASTFRLSLRKGKGDQRICKIYDSPNLPEMECIFQLYINFIQN